MLLYFFKVDFLPFFRLRLPFFVTDVFFAFSVLDFRPILKFLLNQEVEIVKKNGNGSSVQMIFRCNSKEQKHIHRSTY